jgi:hypothetical protein
MFMSGTRASPIPSFWTVRTLAAMVNDKEVVIDEEQAKYARLGLRVWCRKSSAAHGSKAFTGGPTLSCPDNRHCTVGQSCRTLHDDQSGALELSVRPRDLGPRTNGSSEVSRSVRITDGHGKGTREGQTQHTVPGFKHDCHQPILSLHYTHKQQA